MLEDQLLGGARFKQHGKFIETLDASGQLRPVQQIERHSATLASRRVEKSILNVLGSSFCIHHYLRSIKKSCGFRLHHAKSSDKLRRLRVVGRLEKEDPP